MNGYCNIHQVPFVLKRMGGGWTTVCPWCDQFGKYDRRSVRSAGSDARGYQYRGAGVGVVGYTNTDDRERNT